jgi:rhamnogalacturonan endolyase
VRFYTSFVFLIFSFWAHASFANVPGGGTGTGANVTVTDNGGTVVLANGIVSLTINKTSGNISNFTYNGTNLLAGGNGGGSFYFDGSGGPTLTNPVYTLTVNPANNGGNQAEVWLQSTASPMDMAIYYDLLRGQQGIYDTVIFTHEAGYPDYPGAELRTNMYVGSIFDWLCVDPYRFRQMAPPNTTVTTVPGAPPEVMQWTAGPYNGFTNCKYSYSSPLGRLDTWGWASSTSKYGVWQTVPSHEYYDGGPMHRELTEHIGNTLLNMFGGGHYGFGSDGDEPAGTFVSKTIGPAFIYANQYAGAASDPVSLKARVLWADAEAQAEAEQSAWPYTWFNPQPVTGATGTVYPQAAARGTVSGTLAINDPNAPGTSPASLWIGLAPVDGGVDFQNQYLTSQFWVKTGAGGAFSIPNVLPGTYNLWAFGPGVVGTFEKANVTVAVGSSSLGTLTWSPLRLGPTVWEIGTPDRDSNEFNNGEHQSTPYSGVLPAYAGGPPYDVPAAWGAFMGYPTQYPNGVSFVVGTSDPGTDWNYCQPTVPSGTTYAGSTSKIFFNLAAAPTAAQNARLYIAFASAFSSACILTINGTVQTASVMGSTDGNYTAITNSANGFYPPNVSFDSILRLGSQGAWGDAYLNFAGNKLKAGTNEIDIGLRPTGGASLGEGFEYDYVRLELTGYSSGTPSPTPTVGLSTATATRTSTASPTPTLTASPTLTVTFTKTTTPTASVTKTWTSSPTLTSTATASITKTSTVTPTRTSSPTVTATASVTKTITLSPTMTVTATFSSTQTASPTLTATATASASPTATPSVTSTATPSVTATPSSTPTLTATQTTTTVPSLTATSSATVSSTFTATLSPTSTQSLTQTPTATLTKTSSPSATPTETWTVTLTATQTKTPLPTDTFTSTPTITLSPTVTPTPTQTLSATPTATLFLSPTETGTFTQGPPITTPIPFPNPAPGPTVTATFTLRDPSPWVHVEVFTTAFRKVNQISLVNVPAGPARVSLPLTDKNGSPLANGVYYLVVVNQQGRAIGKLLVLR